jgi:IS5 family transposase
MRGLFDYEFQLEKINAKEPPLYRLNKVIGWEWFRETIETALYVKPKGPGGRPPFDRLLMFKILILQRYYNLSEAQTEFQIRDRLSFMQFLGLQIGDDVPDENTIWDFKQLLAEKGLSESLFEQFSAMLSAQGIVAKEGSIVDASFVDLPKQHNTREENARIKAGKVPESFRKNRAKCAQKDTDARWAMKNKEVHYGGKNHINVDAETKLITRYEVTDASVHDSQAMERLVTEEDRMVHADSAYRSETIEAHLRKVGCQSRIHEKGYRNRPLTKEQKIANKEKSKIRARVEHVFGYMTNSMHEGLRLRCIGMKRMRSTVGLLNLTYNLFRYEQLVRLQKVPML